MEDHVIDIDELNKITEKAREEKRKNFLDRIEKGRTDAIKHITEGCIEKMKDSASKGYGKTILYSFQWVKERDDKVDANGNKVIFEGNVRLLDLINKGKNEFLNDLNKFFNKDGNDKYHCFIKKNNKDEETNLCTWTIYVSWSNKPYYEKNKSNKPYLTGGTGGSHGYKSQNNRNSSI
jgi:hypothetical protein